MKFLLVGLGNPGAEYTETRHNIGFKIVEKLASDAGVSFFDERLAQRAEWRHKGKTMVAIKPSTFMNLSGNAVRYWLQAENIAIENMVVTTDDLALPFGKIRLRGAGSAGTHNGLTHIQEVLQTQNYARLRFGIGDDFERGRQVAHVLGQWNEEEKKQLPSRIDLAAQAMVAVCLSGVARAMNDYNSR